jgi:hypothetical protein
MKQDKSSWDYLTASEQQAATAREAKSKSTASKDPAAGIMGIMQDMQVHILSLRDATML